jgi:2'-5' RNA ligase
VKGGKSMAKKTLVERCIMIFPKFNNINLIEDIRKQSDPLYHHVRPHVTLVFPFKSTLTKDELREHIENSIKEDGGYLFLNVVVGREDLVKLHHQLYLGILQPYYPGFLKEKPYSPHMTIGRIHNQVDLNNVVDHYNSMDVFFEEDVEEVSVEIIDENQNSIIEMILNL